LERREFDDEGYGWQNVGSMMEIYRWRGARCWDGARMEVTCVLSDRIRKERKHQEVRAFDRGERLLELTMGAGIVEPC